MPTAPDLKWLNDKKIPGGNSLMFNAAQLLFIKAGQDLKETEFPFNGFKVKIQAIKNKLFTPHIEVTLVFSFDRGFSNFWTNWELLKEYKRVDVASWCKLPDYPEKKFRQCDAGKVYEEDPKFKEIFDGYVQDVLKIEFIDKYKAHSNEGAF
jgi:hypothetical protein